MFTFMYALILAAALGGAQLAEPKGWFKAGSDPDKYAMGIEKGAGMDGKDAATIYARSEKIRPMAFGTLMQGISAEKYVGKRIRLTGYMKSRDVQEWAGLWLRVDAGKQTVSFDNMEQRAVKGTTDWKQYEIVLDVPPGSTSINYGALVGRTGQIWFDKLALEVVDNTVPLTTTIGALNLRANKPYNMDLTELWPGNDVTSVGTETPYPKGWFKQENGTNIKVVYEPGAGMGKSNAFALTVPGKGTATAYQMLNADEYRGSRVRISGWIKTQDVKKHAGLWVFVSGKDDKKLTWDYMWDKKRNIKGTTDWTHYEIVVDVPKDAEGINYGIFQAQSGQVWASNFSFETVDATVPVTGKGDKLAHVKMQQPLNMDFEE